MSYLRNDLSAANEFASNVEQSSQSQGLPLRRKIEAAIVVRVAAIVSLGFLCWTGVARAEQNRSSISDLYKGVADAVVSISAEVTHPSQSSLGSKQAPQSSSLEEMLSGHTPDQAQPGEAKSSDDSGRLGSGFVIDERGIIVTANHVIGDADDIEVIFSDGRMLRATVVGSDREIDVAVLQVNSGTPLHTVKFGDSDAVSVGDPVVAVGNPFGFGETVTAGIISARHRNVPGKPFDSFLQTDAAMNRGNSGGPLFNMAGEVIGINTAIFSPSGDSIGLGFATPAATATGVIEELEKFHMTRRGWFGADFQSLNYPLANSLGLDSTRGALISGLDPTGPAALAGVEIGDVVVKLASASVADAQDMRTQLEPMPEGKSLDISILRDGGGMTLNVVLGRKPSEGEAVPAATGDAAPGMDREASAFERLYGLKLSTISEGGRAYLHIREGIKGVVVFGVIANSSAAKMGFQVGDVIVQIAQQKVSLPREVRSAVETLRQTKKSYAPLFVSNPAGATRFAALPLPP